jgi:hypothetical protein
MNSEECKILNKNLKDKSQNGHFFHFSQKLKTKSQVK